MRPVRICMGRLVREALIVRGREGEIMKSEKLFEMVKSLQEEAGDIENGFNEFDQVIEDWLFEAIQENYLTPKGKKSLESRIKSCFMLEKNIKKWGGECVR